MCLLLIIVYMLRFASHEASQSVLLETQPDYHTAFLHNECEVNETEQNIH